MLLLYFIELLKRALIKDISAEEETFRIGCGQMQSLILFHRNEAGWRDSLNWLGVLWLCMLLETPCDLGTRVPYRRLHKLRMLRGSWRLHVQRNGMAWAARQCLLSKLFSYHIWRHVKY